MLTLAECKANDVRLSILAGKFRLVVGPYVFKVRSTVPEFQDAFNTLYAQHRVFLDGGGYDFDVEISAPSLLRRFFRRSANFNFSGTTPFLPMEVDHAHAMFEWGLNWVVASHHHEHLVVHSAVVEYQGIGIIFPASSGSGKSTLVAELALSGWNLLSDELTLIGDQADVISLFRPISLKNDAIEVIRHRFPQAVFGPVADNTHKGKVAHVVPEMKSGLDDLQRVPVRLIIFPKWRQGSELSLKPLASGPAAMRLIEQAFNYSILGVVGFDRLVTLVQSATAWELEYSDLDSARAALTKLVADFA